MEKAQLIIDGQPATTWASNRYTPTPTITFDLQRVVTFNRIVVFNRYTDMRGTLGGNNAAHMVEIQVSATDRLEDLRILSTIDLKGPKSACIKNGNGQICFFIDNTEPQDFVVTATQARLVQIAPKTAYWGERALEEWKSSVALSEVMLFNVP